jgi:hypothetical protein
MFSHTLGDPGPPTGAAVLVFQELSICPGRRRAIFIECTGEPVLLAG